MNYKRILLIRTDRIGDVLLTTPAIEAVRKKFPQAHISVMVRPYTKDIVDENPYVDEVILYDKYGKDKSITANYLFSRKLKKRKFDIAVIFHPTNRTHLLTYLAAIPMRIGYDRNMPFLLTNRIKHTKQSGDRHESDYAMEVLKPLGIAASEKGKLHMPIKMSSENSINALFATKGIGKNDKIIVFHPGASCKSKIWPADRFAQVADKIIQDFQVKIMIVGGNDQKDIVAASAMEKYMLQPASSLIGKLSISELASCLKRASLFISNDSGPIHIACAVETPSVVIFGRSLPGLAPKRWEPCSGNNAILHKDVGCLSSCLAHNCQRSFACLNAVTVDEVYQAAVKLLQLT